MIKYCCKCYKLLSINRLRSKLFNDEYRCKKCNRTAMKGYIAELNLIDWIRSRLLT